MLLQGAQWLSGRVLDSRPKGRGFEPHWHHCVVSLSKNIYPSLVLVQPRKTRPFITERLLMGRKESNQTNKTSVLLWRLIWLKRTQKCVYGDEMFLFSFQYYSNICHPLTVYCTSVSTLPTFQCSFCTSPHQSMVDYTGHFMTYVILSFCQSFSTYECKNEE